MVQSKSITRAISPATGNRRLPTDTRHAFYDPADVQGWMHARILGKPWQPLPADPGRPLQLITRREMLRRVGLSYPTIWRLEKAGLFPAPIKLVPSGIWEK